MRNLMVQSEFNLYLQFKSYDFFKFAKTILYAWVSGAWVDGIAYHGIVKGELWLHHRYGRGHLHNF